MAEDYNENDPQDQADAEAQQTPTDGHAQAADEAEQVAQSVPQDGHEAAQGEADGISESIPADGHAQPQAEADNISETVGPDGFSQAEREADNNAEQAEQEQPAPAEEAAQEDEQAADQTIPDLEIEQELEGEVSNAMWADMDRLAGMDPLPSTLDESVSGSNQKADDDPFNATKHDDHGHSIPDSPPPDQTEEISTEIDARCIDPGDPTYDATKPDVQVIATGHDEYSILVQKGGMFPVLVTFVSGSMGDLTTQCAAAYKVTDLSGNNVLAGSDVTPIQPAKPRPAKGLMVHTATVGTGIYDGTTGTPINTPAYGVGFYDRTATTPDHFVLWDAGEVEATKVCAS